MNRHPASSQRMLVPRHLPEIPTGTEPFGISFLVQAAINSLSTYPQFPGVNDTNVPSHSIFTFPECCKRRHGIEQICTF